MLIKVSARRFGRAVHLPKAPVWAAKRTGVSNVGNIVPRRRYREAIDKVRLR
jgi:hypothetical protein